MCFIIWQCVKTLTVIISLDKINAVWTDRGPNVHHTELHPALILARKHDALHPANNKSLIQFYAEGFRLHSTEAPCCWHCNVIHLAVNVIHLLLLCHPTVLVDIVKGCVRWAEWNPNEGVARSARKATPAHILSCSSIRHLLTCTYSLSTGDKTT